MDDRTHSAISIFCAQLFACLFLAAAIFAPSYHYQPLMLPTGANLLFDLSLFRVSVTSACVSALLTVTHDEVCEYLVDKLNGQSIRDAANILCGAEALWHNMISVECSELSRLSMASIMTLFCLCIASVAALTGLSLVVIFFTRRPETLIRRALLVSQFASVIFCLLGILFYTLIGGAMKVKMFVGAPMSSITTEFSYGGGAAVGLCATLWCCTLPLWTHWAIRLKYCEDYYSEKDERRDEMNQLMTNIQYEASQLDPHTARAILYPATGQNIVNWYWSNQQ